MSIVSKKTIKRFYKQAESAPADGGFGVRLDGKPIKTPAGHALVTRSPALAEAVAAEWNAQGDEVRPCDMPMTQLASTALDRIGPERAMIVDQLIKYAATDLLCYHAGFPPALAERQHTSWQPLLDWAATDLDAPLAVTSGVIAVNQPETALAALRRHLGGYDLWRLTATQAAAAAAGSLILAMALAEGRLDGEQVFALSQLDETFQIEQWGEDYEAADRRAALMRDILAAEKLLSLARSGKTARRIEPLVHAYAPSKPPSGGYF